MARWSWLPVVVGLLGVAACDEGAPLPARSPAEEGKKREAPGVPTSQLGHYASPDGFIGLVLDRTGDKPRLKLDKTTDVVELFVEDALDHGSTVGHWLNGPDGEHWLYLGEDGTFAFIKPELRAGLSTRGARDVGRASVPMSRDGDAEKLGEATQKGIATPPPEKTPYDLAAAKLTALSVVKRWQQFKPEDSGNLAKVDEALQSIDAAMLVRVSAKGAEKAYYAPASPYIGDTNQSLGGRVGGYPSDEAWDHREKGLARYGGLLWDRPRYGSPSRLRLHTRKGWPQPLAAGTPGMIWMVDGTTVVFVALDGGRYHLELSGRPETDGLPIEMGAGSPAAWPAPVQHALFDVDSVRGLAKGAAVPAKVGADMEALDDAYWACVNEVWAQGRRESDKIETSQESIDKKSGKLSSIPKRYENKAVTDCEGARKKLEEGLVAFIEERSKQRISLHERAKARAAALGVE